MAETQLRIIFEKKHLTQEKALAWIKSAPNFQAVQFKSHNITKGRLLDFDEKAFCNCFEKDLRKSPPMFITLVDLNGNEMIINMGRYAASLIVTLNTDTQEDLNCWADYINTLFEDGIGIVACIYPEQDYFWQQNIDLGQYEKYGKPTENLKLKQIDHMTMAVDRESLPGNSLYVDDVWFGSTWMMWFGPEYFKFIPSERLLQFNEAFEIKKLSNGTIVIQLYKTSSNVTDEESRKVQWAFRNFFSINELVRLLRNRSQEAQADPSIEIFTSGCEHGGVRLINLYLDKDRHNVPRSQAQIEVSYEVDTYGNTVWESERLL